MAAFRYLRPRTMSEAIAVLDEHGAAARVLAGGTDVLVRLRLGHLRPAVVLDVKDVPELDAGIVETDGVLRVGARTVMTDLIADARVRRHFPALADAASVVGSVQIRNRATLAGNICNASPAADTAPALLVYGAIVHLAGPHGTRQVPLETFFLGPGKTVVGRGELVTAIDLPVPAAPVGAAFGRVTRRRGVDLATINLCCSVTRDGQARFAFGAVAPTPILVADASGAFAPDAPAHDRDAAIQRLIGHARPISDVRGGREYRQAMLAVMSRRSWTTAIDRLTTRNESR
ncbi:MAG: xanthine dehydrogenase family protein subunit M [Acidobacteria bacterium]|nr:xanthine dehydrogenase family protein subunit M [Acidobacteriota bacterium]